ncbi:MAG: peptidylprolyl isomerase, partial [Candidatus Bathyarchaeia archaeon]
GMEASQKKTLEVPPEKGYGARDPSKVKLLPLRRFTKEGLNPAPGLQVEIDRKPALIRSVGAGRVQVDFNHPLSGKTLLYDVSVEKVITDSLEKVKSLIHRRIPSLNLEKTKIKLANDTVTIELPEDSFFIEGLQLMKRYVAEDLQKYLPEVKTVEFVERFQRAEAPAPAGQRSAQARPGREQPPQP